MSTADKTLYLCFAEHKDSSFAYVIQAIKLSDLLSSYPNTTSSTQVAYASSDDNVPALMTCGAFGSKILFVGGQKSSHDPLGFGPYPCRDIYVFETDPNFGTSKLRLGQDAFPQPKKKPILVELHGRLYALSHAPVDKSPRFSFDVFDSSNGYWYPLPEPPSELGSPDCYHDSMSWFNHYAEDHYFSHLTVGSNLFLFRGDHLCHATMLRYNMLANHNNETWKIVAPIQDYPRDYSVGVDDGDGNFVIFDHKGAFTDRSTLIEVYLMSQDGYYSLRRIKPDLELNMDNGMLPPPEFRRGVECRFVHLAVVESAWCCPDS